MKARILVTFIVLTTLTCIFVLTTQVIADQKTSRLDAHVRALDFSKSVPGQLNYQGFLVDAADSSAVTATLEMTFRLFDSESKGAQLWSETHPAVDVDNGLFQVLLGSVTPFPGGLFDGSTLWLQTEVGAEVLTPRKPLVSVAYSQRTEEADHAVHADTAAYTQVAGMTVADSAAVADNAHQLEGENLSDLDNRYVNEEDLDHLNAADGDPANAVYVDATGKVGIGTSSPLSELDVSGSVNATTYFGDGSNLTGISGTADADWTIDGDDIYHQTGNVGIGTTGPTAPLTIHTVSGADIQFTTSGNNADIKAPVAFNIGTTNTHRLYLLTDNMYRMCVTGTGDVGIGTTSPSKLLDVAGSIQADTLSLGSATKAGTDGELRLYRGGSADPVVHSYADNYGGNIILNDELGNLALRLHADHTGSGGELWLGRDVGKLGIELIGNSGGSNEPVLGITGSTRSAFFYMNQPGNSSVVLPNDAISAPEMLDEPGIARNSMSGGTSIAASGVTHIINQSITVPGPGYIMARGYLYGGIHGTSIGNITVGIGTSSTAPPTLPDAVVFGSDNEPLSSSHCRWGNLATERTFTVAAGGTYTYYLNAERLYTDGTAMVWYPKLILIYFPTNYGSVTKSGGTVMSSGAVDDGVGKSQ